MGGGTGTGYDTQNEINIRKSRDTSQKIMGAILLGAGIGASLASAYHPNLRNFYDYAAAGLGMISGPIFILHGFYDSKRANQLEKMAQFRKPTHGIGG